MSELLPGLVAGGLTEVRVGDERWTYDALLGAAATGVLALRDLARTSGTVVGGAPSDGAPLRVAVHADADIGTVVAVVAGVLAGVTVVPVPPDAGTAERRHVLVDSGAVAWLGDPPPADVREDALPVVPLPLGTHAAHDPDAAEGYDAEATALLLYTSGTTGPPKGVLMSRRAVAAGLDGLAEAWRWTHRDRLAHGLPLFHVHGLVLGVLGALRVGCALHHVGRPTPAAYAEAARDGATVLFGVPTVWGRLADAPDDAAALRDARLLVSGSAALPTPVHERLAALTGHQVRERYGMSETLITVATPAPGRLRDEVRPGWVGVPVAGVETRLVDDHGRPVPTDGETMGRLEVRGPTLFSSYLGLPDATAEAWTDDGWFRTGDLAVVDARGWHRIVGRESTDLVKSGGYRIGAGEVETALLGHPAVAEVAVVGEPDPDLGQRLVAWVVPAAGSTGADGSDGLAAELTAYVGEQLSAHKRPREVRFTDSLPRNALGKVQKNRLLSPEQPSATD